VLCYHSEPTHILSQGSNFPFPIQSHESYSFYALKKKFLDIGLAKQDDRETITDLIDYQGFCAGPNTTKPAEPVEPVDRTMDEVETSCSKGDDSFHTVNF
jgi:hypothetical protein